MFDLQVLKLPHAKGALVACIVFSLAYSACVCGQAISLSTAIVSLWEGALIDSQVFSIAVFFACFILRRVVSVAEDAYMERFSHARAAEIQRSFLDAEYERGEAISAAYGSGAVVSDSIEGIRKIENYIRITLPKTVALLTVPFCIAIAVLAHDVLSGVIVLVCYPFIIAFMRLIGHSAKDESAKRHDGFVSMSNHFLDALRGMGTLRAFGISKAYGKTVFTASERYRKLVMKTLRIAQLSSCVLDLFATGGLAAVAIMLGFRMAEGSLPFYPALVVLMLVPEYFMPIRAYAQDYHATLDGKSALEHVLSAISTPKRKASLHLEGLSVSDGDVVAILGRSGSGKSTTLDLVAGLVESPDASIEVCGRRPADFAKDEWQRRLAYIPQAPHLLSASLRDNVRLYNPKASDDEIMDALQTAGIGADFVGSLPKGLDTVLGNSGRTISGGEGQRIMFARALLDSERDIWLLDEPGANLDAETEMALVESVAPLLKDRTAVISTHRMAWADIAGKVVMLDA